MSYNQHSPHPDDPGEMMNPEEEFVREALHAYEWVDNYRIWIPCSILYYKVYLPAWNVRLEPYPGDPDPYLLSVHHFGAALHGIFPNSVDVRRRHGTIIMRGRTGIEGPLSLTSGKAGRPPKGRLE